jgi:sugar lactone lactonase YvrE/CheY-like chemotaxis protein
LRSLGCETREEESLGAAILRLRVEPADLLLLDRDAYDDGKFLEDRGARDRLPPVVLMTGVEERPEHPDLLARGVFACLSKPVPAKELRRLVSELLERKEAARARRRRRLALLAVAVLAGAAGAAIRLVARARVESLPPGVYALREAHPSALSWDGSGLWVADGGDLALRRYEASAGLKAGRAGRAPGPYASGLAWDGRSLWVSDAEDGRIVRLDPSTFRVLSAVASPGPAPSGLTWDGRAFWVADLNEMKVYRFSVENGRARVLVSWPSPGPRPVGLAASSGALWSVDAETGRIYRHDPATGAVLAAYRNPLSEDGRFLRPSGLAADGTALWICSESARRLLRVPLRNLSLVPAAPGGGE